MNREHTRDYWWLHEHDRLDLYKAIATLKRVLFHGFPCKYLSFSFLPTDVVFAAPHVVLALDKWAHFAMLQSSLHESWVRHFGSTLETRMRYPASDVLETFPFCSLESSLDRVGEEYYLARGSHMQGRGHGMTATYNVFHDPSEAAPDTRNFRDLHVEMDYAIAVAYGWSNLKLGHDFHNTKQGVRFTISDAARLEVLARLLKLNHERYSEEVLQSLHDKGKSKPKAAGRKGKKSSSSEEPMLF